MKKRSKRRLIWNYIVTFFGFFLLSGITTTVSFMIFLNSLALPIEHIKRAAPITFFNLVFVASIFALIGTVWKKISVEKPIEEINSVLLRMKKGDFSAKLKRRYYSTRYSTMVNIINVLSGELSSIDNLKVSLMSNISHELKTPISIISNYATLLQDTSLSPEKQSEYAKAITESSKKMTELITNILKLNQLENQKIPTEMVYYDLSEQLCECLLNFEDIWEEKNIEVETDIEDSFFVKSDMNLLNIVWNNLFSNAFKFTPENGKVSVEVTQSSKHVTVTISDTGCGIPKEEIENIFEKFYQCDTSRATDGNGLGLALVRRIINITKSYISVESAPGKGSVFKVKVPKN